MKTYLITGCAGFIGSNFVHYMLKKYPEILLVNLDKLTYAGNLENLKDVEGDPRHVFVQGDICDKELVESLFAKYDFDYVINFAAESHVDRSIKNPEIFVQSNVMGTVNLLQRAKEAWYDADAKTWKEGKKYIQSLPMRSTALWVPRASSWRPPRCAPTAPTPLPRPARICSSRHSTIPTVCPSTSPAAPTTTAPTSSPRS